MFLPGNRPGSITLAMLRHAAIPAVAATLLIAGCGSSSPGAGDPSSAASLKSAGIQFASCMRSHGVPNFPDPSGNGGGGLQIQSSKSPSGQSMSVNGVPVDAPAFESAMSKCQKYMPRPKALPGGITQVKANALKFARCMRSNGVPNFPDPTVKSGPNGGIGVQVGGPGIDPQSPALQAAQRKCRPLMDLPGGGLPAGSPSNPNSQLPSGKSSGSG